MSAPNTTRRLVVADAPGVGGTRLAEPDADGFVSVAALDTRACWGLGPGWLILEVHADVVGSARARLVRGPVALTRHWAVSAPEEDAPWRPGRDELGGLGAKLDGRPGFLQSVPPELARLEADGHRFLAQIDCETGVLYEPQQSLLCDGALYAYGRVEDAELVHAVVLWQY